ncbi:MAG: hypothetical protein O2887_06545 [Bacteroidetes bacterium]|nr:hypothetical protein [Bacteroidota bacterium]MDA1120141.1 hypothetical protein [Bacteroidota bacterium]
MTKLAQDLVDMRKFLVLLVVLGMFPGFLCSHDLPKRIERLSIFVDCSNTWCDMNYIRTELPVIDYSRDRIASDIHVLLTSQNTGGGGRGYQLIMYGQKGFVGLIDTISFALEPNSTDFERRELIVNNLKIGIVPYLIRNGQTDIINVSYKLKSTSEKAKSDETNDPWNYWVYQIGGNGRVNLDQNYKSYRLGGNVRAYRTTNKKKLYFRFDSNTNHSEYKYENDDGETETTIVENSSNSFEHFLIWSLGEKWAYGYEIGYNTSTFNNLEKRLYITPSIEYNLFPYKDVNNKLLTLRYGLASGKNFYNETTIYGKDNEMLVAEYLSLSSIFNQKWGNVGVQMKYQHYFHDFGFNRLSFESNIEVRITGGLSLDLYLYGARSHDQIYLPLGDADAQEVLTRQRALASNFDFSMFFGLNYRFGSNINNFINPRFGSRGF